MSDFRLDETRLDILTLDGPSILETAPTDEAWYYNDGLYFGFQNANVISQYFRQSNPNPQIGYRALPRADGRFAEVLRYESTALDIEGTIQSTSRAAMEALLDDMRRVISPLTAAGGTLQLTMAGAPRLWDNCYPTATIGQMYHGRDFYHVLYCPFKITFESNHPYGRAASRTIYSPTSSVTADHTFGLTNDGTAPGELIVTIPVLTAGTLSQITITNNTTGEAITIARSFSNGDTLEVNAEGKFPTVKVNGSNVDFSGIFPTVKAGDNSFTITFTGSGYTVGLTAQFYARYF